ncbi:hypothetical protein [Streptomyces hydrogenans]|uniref:hypothetical protein n=1 Tax=Streptomyces hydrogenans TaxID=1873719 RepID=UPI0037FAA6E1
MTGRWGTAAVIALMCVTGCSGVGVQRGANEYDYAMGYLSGGVESSAGRDKGSGCVQQLQDYEAAMDEGAIPDVRKYFMKGCMDGYDGVSPAMWPKGQPRP